MFHMNWTGNKSLLRDALTEEQKMEAEKFYEAVGKMRKHWQAYLACLCWSPLVGLAAVGILADALSISGREWMPWILGYVFIFACGGIVIFTFFRVFRKDRERLLQFSRNHKEIVALIAQHDPGDAGGAAKDVLSLISASGTSAITLNF